MKIKTLTVVVIIAFAGVAAGQTPGSSARDIRTEIQKTDPRVDQIIERANDHFNKGKLNLKDNQRAQARDEFDKALDEILTSGLDVRAGQRLQTFYLELVERIYREEVPLIRSASQQDVKSASQNQIGFRQQPLRPSSFDPPSKSVSTENATLKAEQKPCTLGIEAAPAIRGIRLRMTISEVKALYPGISEPTRYETGRSMTYLRGRDGNEEKLKGIGFLFLHMFGGRIFQIRAGYEESYGKEAMEIIRPFGLPEKDYATTTCRGFGATLFRHSDNTLAIELIDTVAWEKIIALSQDLEERSADCQKIPVIRQIGLGMTLAKFRTLYPRSREVRRRNEVGELVLHGTNGGDLRLQGISDVWAYFLDGGLYLLAIDYTGQVQWKGIDQFVEQFSKRLGLRTKWDGSEFLEDRTLRCHSFIVKAQMKDGHPRVIIQDRTGVTKLNKREEQLKSPSSFRP